MEHVFNEFTNESTLNVMETEMETNIVPSSNQVETITVSDSQIKQDISRFSSLEAAYQSLQNKVTENQVLIHYGREQISALRKQIRDLQSDFQFDEVNDEGELHQSKVCVQNDDCNALVSHAEQIREHIYHNSTHAESLLQPLKKQVALLELRVQHVRAIEKLLNHIRDGIALEQRVTDIDGVLAVLAQKLDVVY